MALVIPPNHYQALIPFKHDDVTRAAAVTLGFNDPAGVNDPATQADTLLVNFSAAFQTVIDSNVLVGPVQVTFDQGENGRGSVSGSASFRGGRSGESIYANTAILMRKNTSRVGRPGRGRMFIPWAVAANVISETGALRADVVADFTDRGETFLEAMATDDMNVVILHDESVPNADSPSLVSSLVPDPIAGTQRRRMRF